MSLSFLVSWKSNNYNTILLIINHLTKLIYYKVVKTIIDTTSLKNYYRCSDKPSQLIEVNYEPLKLLIYLKVPVFLILRFW